MLLIIENDPKKRISIQHEFFAKFAINACGASYRLVGRAFERFPVCAAYIPNTEAIPNPVGFCRRFKQAYPHIPLVAAVGRTGSRLDLDALYTVTDNIPLLPLATVRVAEILCELMRLYTGRDHVENTVHGLYFNIYTFSVYYGGIECFLGANSLSILRYLAWAEPRPVTATELALGTCSPLSSRTTSCMRTHVYDINRKCVAAFGNRVISHTPGEGYRIHIRPQP